MSAEIVKDTINTLIFLLPVLTLVWKGAKLTSRLEHVEEQTKEMGKELEKQTENIEENHNLLQKKIEQEHTQTDKSINAIMSTLTEIQKSLVRVETKLDLEEQKK